jgi:hypothetical protein
MKHQNKLHSEGQEQEQPSVTTQEAGQTGVQEFASPEAMLRHDALHTPVPPAIARRLRESIGKMPQQPSSWWKRLLGGAD